MFKYPSQNLTTATLYIVVYCFLFILFNVSAWLEAIHFKPFPQMHQLPWKFGKVLYMFSTQVRLPQNVVTDLLVISTLWYVGPILWTWF